MSMVSAGLSVVGGAIQAAGAMQAAEAEAQAHEYDAAVATRNIGVIRQQTRQAKADQRIENKRALAAVRAEYGHSGMAFTGSALDVYMDSTRETRLDVARIGYRGELMVIEQKDKRTMSLMGAETARQAGQISAAAAILGGLTGAVNAMQ